MNNREYIVMGLGNFGRSVALQLERNGCKVLALDVDAEKVKSVADEVTYAMCVDVTDAGSLKEVGVRNFDCAVIAMGGNLEATVLSIIWMKEQGVKQIIAKTNSELQAKILKKVGADEVVFPEQEMGIHLANNLSMNNIFDTIELSDDYSIVDFDIPESWVGKSLIQLKCREKYGINVIGVKRHGQLTISPPADAPSVAGDVFVVIGKNDVLKKLLGKVVN
ncbi:MAG: potassium channel family protein [Lachnospiraceae bacterium]